MRVRRAIAGAVLGAALCLAPLSLSADEVSLPRAPHEAQIGARTVSFLAVDLETGTRYTLEGSDLDTRHTPWSTFKIPNLLIGLATGVETGLDHRRAWDAARRPARGFWPDAWRQDNSLRSAFRHSTVWYFRDIAEEVGTAEYRARLADWDYGNAEVPGGSDGFWLDGSLQISVEEQVSFLSTLLTGGYAVSEANLAALIDVSLDGEAAGVTLHGKTGAGAVRPSGRFEGWYVGFLLRDTARPVVFALYGEAANFRQIRAFRRAFALDLLDTAGLLPAGLSR